ncbi:5-oxoprolinase subunit PxpB [Zavarzinia sp. CC-PAN008]|uniref:5-oxoprolinase subunit PxpB n=1 Tax=Zavarzinia sp. CC-PAN008 TaxID=3243332 RepID=UPI003F742138
MSPRILPCGDAALSVEFGAAVDPDLNARVLALDGALAVEPVAGIVETVPTYRALFVQYDPTAIGFEDLAARLRALADTAADHPALGRLWRVPVVYGGAFGEDLAAVAAHAGLTPDEVIARHTARDYRVYMIGFTPGFAYLGGLDPALAMPRRAEPRGRTPTGAISIGGVQTGIHCIEAPSGWNLLGRTPVRTFQQGRDPMFLLEPGDRIRFEAVPADAWDDLDAAAARGEPVATLLDA